ncbi:MAG TPA: pyrroloquinoline quinone-dependent dehydrogenase [Jatrophihabitantaceae bacterium]|nr:pyrroloquinoline quinone-dependent dehydrogenase [Jatrophihabitantaceae bacterium]
MKRRLGIICAVAVLTTTLGVVSVTTAPRPAQASAASAAGDEWGAYGRDPGGARHSPLTQITRENVGQLQPAWTVHTGDVSDPVISKNWSNFEATPLYLFGSLYLSTGFDRVLALDPENGQQRWAFDPHIDRNVAYVPQLTSRGVAAWAGPDSGACTRRIFIGTLDARLIGLDADTGQPCAGFGQGGTIDLGAGLPDVNAANYGMTSPPAVIGDTVVAGSMVLDGVGTNVPTGVVRGYDVRTGALKWSYDPIPRHPGDPGYDKWTPEGAAKARAANVWSVITADPQRDLVFLPTTSPAPDSYAGERKGPNPNANSVVALRGSTGQFVWAFQTVHHDVFDYDTAAPPAVSTIHKDGKTIPVVTVATKQGFLFVLDERTGQPVFPVEERPVPQTDVPGEQTSPTQPFPTVTPNLIGDTTITPDDAFGLTPVDEQLCRADIAALRSEGIFTPPSVKGTPGTSLGGINWGGVAIDEHRGVLVTTVNRVPFITRLIPRDQPYLPGPLEHIDEMEGTPYKDGRRLFTGLTGVPCTKPPFGTMVAVDLSTGAIKWNVPIGQVPGLAQLNPDSQNWGSMMLGGPIVTDGGLVFMAGTQDNVIRAIDIDTGEELWKGALPAGGQATPMTYRAPNGRQYVLIAAGGSYFFGSFGSLPGDALVAFALP